MKRTQQIAVGLVLLHLTFVGYGASKRRWLKGKAAALVEWYGGISGANTQYGFFAPNVGTQFRAFFDVTEKSGEKTTDVLEPSATGEVDIRMTNVVALFGSVVGNEKVQRSLVASWAGKIFGRHEGAKEVWVRVEGYLLPSMEGFRKGDRPVWKELYRARFTPHAEGEEA